MTGVIIKSTGSWYWVRTASHKEFQCRIKGKFRIKGIKSTSPVTVGDHVDFELEKDADTGIITNIHDRKNYIVRKSVNLSKQTHIIAANIDLAFLLVTLDHPPTFHTHSLTGFWPRPRLITSKRFSCLIKWTSTMKRTRYKEK